MDLLNRTHPYNHGREGYLARTFEEYITSLSARLAAAHARQQQQQQALDATARSAASSASDASAAGRGNELSYEGFDFNHEMSAINHEKLQEFLHRLVSGTRAPAVIPSIARLAALVLVAGGRALTSRQMWRAPPWGAGAEEAPLRGVRDAQRAGADAAAARGLPGQLQGRAAARPAPMPPTSRLRPKAHTFPHRRLILSFPPARGADCLDRTNVVQMGIARQALELQLGVRARGGGGARSRRRLPCARRLCAHPGRMPFPCGARPFSPLNTLFPAAPARSSRPG